jgi:tetratricopeptide (TPR) repeat protein
VRTHEAFPPDWAMSQNDLGTAYSMRIRGEWADNLEDAIAAFEAALTIYTREAFPQDWAMTQNNLGNAYCMRIRGEEADNLERAIRAYKSALTVFTREAFPQDWASTQNGLGNGYRMRIRGERADNLERAIAAFEAALTIRSREASPQDWAGTQNNLGNDRIRGEQADNLEHAIAAFEAALTVLTREALPALHLMTQRNLGNLQFVRENWEAAHRAYIGAIRAGADLLSRAYTETGRRAEVGLTTRLFANDAYALLRLGKPTDALLALEQGKTRLLNEALALGEVDLGNLPDADRAALRTAWQAVHELETEARLPPSAKAFQAMRYYELHPQECSLSHPYHWAAFAVSGA